MPPPKALSERKPGRQPTVTPKRILPLVQLPIFVSLRDRVAVVVGGSAAAAWKAKLLAAAGARVAVFAPAPSPEMLALRDSANAKIDVHYRAWRERDLAGAAFTVADLEGKKDAARFAAAAARAGASCSVIDKPAHCGFQFGAIVNRSSVVIGISTDGAAPVLG